MTKRILFRTDANTSIATGHMMRCLSIAQAVRALGGETVFLLADTESQSVLTTFCENDITLVPDEVHVLQTCFRQPEEELSKFVSTVGNSRATIFVDSYFTDDRYFQNLRSNFPNGSYIAYINDLPNHDISADLVIDYDLEADPDSYPRAGRVLAGAAYAPLRAQFRGMKPEIRPEIKNIMITCGGGDPYHLLQGVTEALVKDPFITERGISLKLVVGALHPDLPKLRQLEKRYPNVSVHSRIGHMAGLMKDCDLGITAGGTTLYELCAAGIPSISYSMADNQREPVAEFARAGVIPSSGEWDNIEGIVKEIKEWIPTMESRDVRAAQSAKMQKLVDGLGAQRIAKALMES